MLPMNAFHAARVAGKNGSSLISDDIFQQLYRSLLLGKVLDERLKTDENYDAWTGREASTAGVTACLRHDDFVAPTARGLLARYLRAGSVNGEAILSAASQLAATAKKATQFKIAGHGNICVLFAQPDHPSRMRKQFAVAASESLPVFYVTGGNARIERVCGKIPVIRVDACDTVAVYRVAHESILRARDGGGPTIMDCMMWPRDDGQPTDALKKLESYLHGKSFVQAQREDHRPGAVYTR